MKPMHSLLKRQLKRCFGVQYHLPEEWRQFIEAIDAAYWEFDVDREMLERSLDLSSQELIQANSEMRAVFQAIPDLLFRLDQDGRILDFKATSTTDLLLHSQEIAGKRFQDIPVKEVGVQFQEAIHRVRKEKAVVSVDYALPLQGKEFFYEARFAPLLENQIVVIVRNISERVCAEEASQKAEQQYRSIFENAVEGMFQSTPQGRFLTVNPALTRMLGYASSEELIAAVTNIHEQLYLNSQQQIKYAKQLEQFGVVRGLECQLYRKDKSSIWVSFYTRAICGPSGLPMRYEGMVEDISERKQLQEQFLQAQKMEAIGTLAGGVAHDFNNLLTVILGNSSMLQGGHFSENDKASAATEITGAAQRAVNLTRQLLTFSRRQPIQAKDFDLNEVVDNMTKMLRRLIGEHISLEARYAPGGAYVHADAGMLEQVLVNLAVNSRDAMPRGGRLIIQTATMILGEDQIRSQPNASPGKYIHLSVGDNGCGIPAENMPHLFEPFYTTKEVGKGTGLGLATVFGIVEQHQGWIKAESQVGVGTTFHVYFPGAERLEDYKASSPLAMPVRGGAETILLVEDDEQVRNMMRLVLKRQGYQIHLAESGVDSLKVWREHLDSINLLITDVIMPGGISGRELGKRLLAEKPDLKIIYCSGYTDEVLGSKSPLRNDDNFIEKPFEMGAFLDKIRNCLDSK